MLSYSRLLYFRLNKTNLLLLLGLIIGAQLFILKSLDYSTSSLTWFSVEEATDDQKPTDKFQIGNLVMDVKMYSESAELEPFRQYFLAHCRGLEGLPAASCLSTNFIRTIPFGEPSTEIFDENYSPILRFEQSLKGAPGHCVTYSSATVNALLSVGIPARFVQVYITEVGGHNVTEVWDKEKGWIFFDPLNNGVLINKDGKYVSALEAVGSTEHFKLVNVGAAHENTLAHGYLTSSYIYGDYRLFKEYVVYPEPWLYTRIGDKRNHFYRASFTAIGEKSYLLGPLQDLLRIGIIFSSLVWIIIFFSFVKRLFPSRVKYNQMQFLEADVTERGNL